MCLPKSLRPRVRASVRPFVTFLVNVSPPKPSLVVATLDRSHDVLGTRQHFQKVK